MIPDKIRWLFDVPLLYFPISILFWGTVGMVVDKLAILLGRRKLIINRPDPFGEKARDTNLKRFGLLFLLTPVLIFSALSYREYASQKVVCGGWDLVNGEVVCGCRGKYVKSSCPEGALCDSGDYYCYGGCGPCRQVVSRENDAEEGSAATEEGNQVVAHPAEYPLASYADYPLSSIPQVPVSTRFLVEHRSALNRKEVLIKGIVVYFNAKAIVSCKGDRCPLMAKRLGVTVAESLDETRDKNYDLFIPLLSVRKGEYSVGQEVVFKVKVYGQKNFVSLARID